MQLSLNKNPASFAHQTFIRIARESCYSSTYIGLSQATPNYSKSNTMGTNLHNKPTSNLLHPSCKECSFREFQTHYSFKEITLLPIITSTNYDWKLYYLFGFLIINECICIGTRQVISTKYLVGSMCYPMQCFLGTWYYFN